MRRLFIDIETLPNRGTFWGTYKQNILQVEEFPSLASYSCWWADADGEGHITRAIPDTDHVHLRDDRQLVQEVWEQLDRADIVIAHYGDGFDLPFMRARFAKYHLFPPSPFKSVDTKKLVAKHFHFGGSYSLGHCCEYLGIGRKLDNGGYSLWRGCMDGDPEAWALMKTYNAHDVSPLLKGLYEHILPWVEHPVTSLVGCSRCGSNRIQWRGFYKARTRIYKRYQCQECGGWDKAIKAESEKPQYVNVV